MLTDFFYPLRTVVGLNIVQHLSCEIDGRTINNKKNGKRMDGATFCPEINVSPVPNCHEQVEGRVVFFQKKTTRPTVNNQLSQYRLVENLIFTVCKRQNRAVQFCCCTYCAQVRKPWSFSTHN